MPTIWASRSGRSRAGCYAGHDVPQFSIHRGRLHAMLWQAATERLGPAAVRAGRRLVGFTQAADRVEATFQDATGRHRSADRGGAGRRRRHPLDAARQCCIRTIPGIRWNGIQMWRGAVDWPAFDGGDSMVIAGDAVAKLVLYPIGPGETPDTRLTNWVIYARVGDPGEPPPARENWSRPGPTTTRSAIWPNGCVCRSSTSAR